MFGGMNDVKRKIWAPLLTALEQIVDATAAIPIDAQIEHRLMYAPNIWAEFDQTFQQRHPAIWTTLKETIAARNRAAHAAAKEDAKQRRMANFKKTMERKKADKERRKAKHSADAGV
jgi:hypothetical protein